MAELLTTPKTWRVAALIVALVAVSGGIFGAYLLVRDGDNGALGVHGYGPRSITRFLEDVRDLVSGRRRRQDLTGIRPSFLDCLVSTAVTEAVNRSLSGNSEWVSVEEASAAASTPVPNRQPGA